MLSVLQAGTSPTLLTLVQLHHMDASALEACKGVGERPGAKQPLHEEGLLSWWMSAILHCLCS